MSERIYKALAVTEQGLTEEQKLQARTNIGAIGGVYVQDGGGATPLTPDANGYVTIDLTNAGKVQSDWDETNSAEPSFIRNKPDLSLYALKDEIETGVFIGVYTGTEETTTPYADYKEAWEDGKAVFLSYVSGTDTLLLPMESISDDEILFTRTVGSFDGNTYGTVINYLAKVSSEDVYTFHSSTMGEEQVQSDWAQTNNQAVDFIKNKPTLAEVATSGSYNDLSDKPTIPAAQVQSDWAQADSSAVDYIKNKPSLSEVATSGDYEDLTNKPTIPAAQVQSDWAQTNSSSVDFIKNKPNLATVATSGSYNDLSDKPTIPGQQQADWAQTNNQAVDFIKNKPNLATVATSGDYADLSNKPTIPAAQVQSDWAQSDSSAVDYIKNKPAAMETKPLVPGTNIEFNSTPQYVEINAVATKVVKRSDPYTTDVPLTQMVVYDPNSDFGSLVRDQNDNTLGYFAPKHYGQADLGKVLTIVNDSGYKMEWRNPSGGSSDLKPLTIAEQHITSTNPVQLTIADGYAYEVINDTSGSLQVTLMTNSTDTVHSVLSFRNGSASYCAQMTIVWRDEALIQHSIEIDFTEGNPNEIYNFDLYIKKVTVGNTDYCIARLSDFPVYYRKVPYQFSTEYEGVGYVGLEM